MTTTASTSRGKVFSDFDSFKSQEWLRRRKLRLEQVRRQSNDLAKVIREKTVDKERIKAYELARIEEENFRRWKAEKIDQLQRKWRSAFGEFGEGYKLANAEPDPNKIINMKSKVNWTKAKERGEVAKKEEIRRKKLAEADKMAVAERKKMARKIEDLRSALIRSVPVQKESVFVKGVHDECCRQKENIGQEKKVTVIKKRVSQTKKNQAGNERKVTVKKLRVKKLGVCHSDEGGRGRTVNTPNLVPSRETVWVNLNDVKSSSASDTCLKSGNSASDTSCSFSRGTVEREGGRGVEFYDYSSRYHCKTYREFPHLIERIVPGSEPSGRRLAIIEEEVEIFESNKKREADLANQERGTEALRKEKINRDYNNLVAKLDELNKKEKLIKAQQRTPSVIAYMTDERLSEKMKTKQRIMDSKFESIYYEATSMAPQLERCPHESGGGDYVPRIESTSTRLSFSPSNPKHNTPVSECTENSHRSPVRNQTQKVKKKTKSKKKKKLLLDIDKTLREGRALRKTVSQSQWKSSESLKESGDEEEREEAETYQGVKMVECFPRKIEKTKIQDKESQTEDMGVGEMKPCRDVVGVKIADDSLPLSTSTSYKSPPSVIRSPGLNRFIGYLENINDAENSKRVKDKMLSALRESNASKSPGKDPSDKVNTNPMLEYYIKKLLDMSREYVADLSVSSENLSTPNITDLDVRQEGNFKSVAESGRSSEIVTKLKEESRELRLKRAEELDDVIRSWKKLLDKHREEEIKESETDEPDEPDYCESESTETGPEDNENDEVKTLKMEETEPDMDELKAFVQKSPRNQKKYEEITQKCSERITELSNLLQKVRRDKRKLLSTTSGTSSLTTGKEDGSVDNNYLRREEEVLKDFFPTFEESQVGSSMKESPVLEGFINRYNLVRPSEENVSMKAVADSQSLHDCSTTSLESMPDVMNELLKRQILTSPFKWSEEETPAELPDTTESSRKPSSIEAAIGNFRKEMSKIKPVSLISPDNQPRCRVSTDDKFLEVFNNPKKSLEKVSSNQFGSFEYQASRHQEESSVESINQALTSLGLNWAKSFLRKNEESKAMSSSSGSNKSASSRDDV